ncbi:MAG TPA: hypothetical protein VG603_08920 [Chitinophagales bacterium]|nr:hypothetical protein [Chitinophagales bacterium]
MPATKNLVIDKFQIKATPNFLFCPQMNIVARFESVQDMLTAATQK